MVAGLRVIQVAYSFGLKQVVIIDVMTLATLFVLRVMAGAEAVETAASEWLIRCTGMLALFLGFTKRRQEAVSERHEGTCSRPVLEHYSLPFLDQMVAMVTTGTVISYAIYTVYSPLVGSRMMLTLPPVDIRDIPLPLPDLRPLGRPLDGGDRGRGPRSDHRRSRLRRHRIPHLVRIQLRPGRPVSRGGRPVDLDFAACPPDVESAQILRLLKKSAPGMVVYTTLSSQICEEGERMGVLRDPAVRRNGPRKAPRRL